MFVLTGDAFVVLFSVQVTLLVVVAVAEVQWNMDLYQ